MTPAEAIETWNADQLRARRAYRLEPTAVTALGCSTCNEPTGTGKGCKTCRKTSEKRKLRAKARKK